MVIGFDAKRAAQNGTGLGNYSRFVIGAMFNHRPGDDYCLYVPSPRRNRYLTALPPNARIVAPSGIWCRLPSLWRSAAMSADIMRDGVELFHGLSNELPLDIRKAHGTRSIVTVHDLIFLRHPSYYKPIDRRIYDFKFRRACVNADRVIAVSECTKRDIMSCYGIDGGKIDVVYQGCDKAFSQVVPDAVKADVARRYALPPRFVLYVGSIEERKNLLLLAQAMRFARHPFRVVAVGRRTPYADKVSAWLERNGLADRVTMLHSVSFADLPAIYQLADVFVYPSRYEGFGIPLLEALCSGVPAIGATGSCLEEAGGSGSVYVNPDDPKELAWQLDRLLDDDEARHAMVAMGKSHAARFTEERLIADLLRTYDKVINT